MEFTNNMTLCAFMIFFYHFKNSLSGYFLHVEKALGDHELPQETYAFLKSIVRVV
jgi:hypothetical protein